jgi:hypothetical protein
MRRKTLLLIIVLAVLWHAAVAAAVVADHTAATVFSAIISAIILRETRSFLEVVGGGAPTLVMAQYKHFSFAAAGVAVSRGRHNRVVYTFPLSLE